MNILQERINSCFPDEKIEVLEYTIMKEPAKVKCLNCNNEYQMSKAENFVRKGKKCICKKCVNNGSGGRLNVNSFQKKIDEKYPNEKLQVLNYTLKNEPCSIKCLTCGNIITLNNAESFMLKNKKKVCNICFPNKKDLIDITKQKFLEYLKDKPFKLITDIQSNSIQSVSLIECECLNCGKISSRRMSDYLRDRGCPYCANNQLLIKEEYQNLLGEEYTILGEYKGKEHPVLLRHNLCGFCYTRNARHYTCPKCSGSKGEKSIAFWLEQNNIKYEREYRVNIQGHILRFDFYIPNKDIFIEYQGEQHFKPVEKFGGEKTFQRQCEYDKLKKDWLSEKNKICYFINYNENIQDKLKEYFLSSTTIQ